MGTETSENQHLFHFKVRGFVHRNNILLYRVNTNLSLISSSYKIKT